MTPRAALELRQNIGLAAWAFVTSALDALMNDDERALFESAATIKLVSDSTDDQARACFDQGGREAAARNMTLDRITRRAAVQSSNFQTLEAA